jgi:hypothetical protein
MIPHFSKARGSDNTPPPIIVAERLKVDVTKLDWRLGDSKPGNSASAIVIFDVGCFWWAYSLVTQTIHLSSLMGSCILKSPVMIDV